MATQLKKYNLAGEEIGTIALEDGWVESMVHPQMVKDAVVAYRAHQRQWSANTQTRAEVNHSGKKPHPQKGTGRARQGYLGSPQYRGGGRVHAPRPKFDQRLKINKKEKQSVIRHILVERILENRLHVLQCEALEKPKTKRVVDFLKRLNIQEKRVLFLGEVAKGGASPMLTHETLVRSMRNIPGLRFQLFGSTNGYELLLPQAIFILEPAVEDLKAILQGGSRA